MSKARPPSVILAGGGTAGHVNPLLAVADAIGRRQPGARMTVLGTTEGLEARLIPERGYPFVTVPKAPFPRRPGSAAMAFPGALREAVQAARRAIEHAQADVVVGFGGYVSTPAYVAARRAGVPIVVHEQNVRAGLANRLGARLTTHVATTFATTELAHAKVVGMPLRREISTLDRGSARPEAGEYFGMDPNLPTVLVTGGSLGAQRLNEAFAAAAAEISGAGVQVLHLTGAGKDIEVSEAGDGAARYVAVPYTDRMDLAYAVADVAVCRAGAGTVCELAAIGLPAIYVPLPVGNGEQRLNAAGVVEVGGGLLVEDGQVSTSWVLETVLPLMHDRDRLQLMSAAAAAIGDRAADETMADVVLAVAGRS